MRIVLYAIWGALMIALVVSVVVQARKARRRKVALATWPKAQAVVTGYERKRRGADDDGASLYYPRYEYRGPDGHVYQGLSETVSDNSPGERAALQVAVNPEDPAESVPEGPTGMRVIGCASVVLGLIGFAMFWFIRMFPLP
ncbi:DUF3592 domain-containing protein [Amycolatopsis sp. NPDC004079]|uniref:DUF3592 domain-containing protein n=1 Tax=Amycolatopsis sp. NPDC004079 TaxID=3154549 RepID=UPI0033BC29C1